MKPTESEIFELRDTFLRTATKFEITDLVFQKYQIGLRNTYLYFEEVSDVTFQKLKNLSTNFMYALASSPLVIERDEENKFVMVRIARKDSDYTLWKDTLATIGDDQSPLVYVLGKKDTGENFMCDLEKQEHLLITGQTGSGKSGIAHNILNTLCIKNDPNSLRVIFIDPKRSESLGYERLPHLLFPIAYSNEMAIETLKWVVTEIKRREKIFEELGIKIFKELETVDKKEHWRYLPYILVNIDEFSDTIISEKVLVEELVTFIASNGHIVGVHLIIATSRPSSDIYTPKIYGAFPTKIAGLVATKDNSVRFLGNEGAENLQGAGDVLYRDKTTSQDLHLQVAFIEYREMSENVQNLAKKYFTAS